MNNVFELRHFQTVRDNVRACGLDPVPLMRQLHEAQSRGERGLAIVGKAQQLKRQFADELPTGPEAA
jgi:hypothetical protein